MEAAVGEVGVVAEVPRRGGGRGGDGGPRRRRSPEVGEAAAESRHGARGTSGSRGPLLGLPGRRQLAARAGRGECGAATWRPDTAGGRVRRWGNCPARERSGGSRVSGKKKKENEGGYL